MMLSRRALVVLSLWIPGGCSGSTADLVNGTTGGATEEEPVPPVLLCADGAPLVIGDAGWASPPFEPPVKGNPVDEDGADGEDEPDGDDEPGGGNDGVSTGGGFITDPDGGGVSVECSVWDQDCSRGEKCAPWANDGGSNHNATKCVPVAPDAGVHGDACTVEGSGVSGVDDCDLGVLCFDVPKDGTDGTCVAMCSGTEENPMCPEGTQCVIDNDGVLPLCLPEMLCVEDGVCQCMCEKTADPDCEPEQCDAPDAPALDPLDLRTQRSSEAESTCPETSSDLELYMSNDDSNSQASPALARAYIEQGDIVPASRVRIHEFLNYYDLSYDNPTDETASVGIQMRRTDPDSGEFTLMVSARSRQMTAEDRPALNLVFSLDTSGSMKGAPMDNLKASMVATASALRAGDVISIVTWAHEQQLVLDGLEVAGPDDPALLQVVDGLVAAGSTDLHGGLVAGYQLANAHHIDGGINRVMLISDGGANAGVTDLDLIASEASDSDGEGTYLLGVGVGVPETYEDTLMDAVTDAGKGAYLFIDSEAEAHRMLDERFLANTMVVARNVRAKLSLPWYFGIKSFHGEEYSSDPAEVEPQHLGPNDTMTFHQVISACEPALITDCDSVSAHIEYTDPLTGEVHSDERTVQIQDLVVENAHVLRKADVVVGYAKALIVIGSMTAGGNADGAAVVASNMAAWTAAAAEELDDPEVDEIAGLMAAYAATVAPADEGE